MNIIAPTPLHHDRMIKYVNKPTWTTVSDKKQQNHAEPSVHQDANIASDCLWQLLRLSFLPGPISYSKKVVQNLLLFFRRFPTDRLLCNNRPCLDISSIKPLNISWNHPSRQLIPFHPVPLKSQQSHDRSELFEHIEELQLYKLF